MNGRFLLIASCCLLAGRLCADPVTFNITSLTGGISGGGPRTSFSGSGVSAEGDSITIDGNGGRSVGDGLISPGNPVFEPFGLDCYFIVLTCSEGGLANIGGRFFSVQLLPGTVTVSFGTVGRDEYTFESASFASTPVPEPSNVPMLLVSVCAVAALGLVRGL